MIKEKLFSVVVVCLFLIVSAAAQNSLKVVEAETRASSSANQIQIELVVDSDLRQNSAAQVRLEILDTNDKMMAFGEKYEKLARGKNTLALTLALTEKNEVEDLLWKRLRYSVKANGSSTEGIVSLSEIMPELFELRVSASEEIYPGMLYLARVRAFHPTKRTPVADVEISAELKIDLETDDDDDELKIKAVGKTDREGFATLEFQIPTDVKFSDSWSGDVEIIGKKNGLTGKADDELRTPTNQISVFFTTDKPLYQPDQKIYVRGLAMRNDKYGAGQTVAADTEFEFSIMDEDDTVLYRQKLKTSRFGIAALEWQIPANAKLGKYRVIAKSDGEDLEADQIYFKVSRYDLPNFVVQTKSDKDFYLPAQTFAEVTVDALYLFGKPVASGKVKVVEESKRSWNYKEQKWDIQEESVYEGEADAEGKYLAKIDLSKAHAELKESEYKDFQDLNFTAYFTDFSTNKTEQKRFDLRVTKEPIQIYIVKGKSGDNNPKLPLKVYVSTFSADGKPLACDVEIKGKYEDEADGQIKTLATIKTNSFGAGKAEFNAPKREDDDYTEDLEIKILARDAENRIGTKKDGFAIDEDEKQILVRTDKAIYRKGEPLKLEILSSEESETVFVDISKNSSNIESRRIKLKNGRAELKIPYDPAFKSQLTVSAYFDDNGEAVEDSRRVVYPAPQNLRVDVETNKDVFRPAEEAALSFNVVTPDKKPSEAALGVVILDRAVEERAKTDANFGGNTDIFQGLDGLGLNGWDELDLKKPISPEMQLFAEMRFSYSTFSTNFFDGDYSKSLQYVFAEKLKTQFDPLQTALDKQYKDNFEHAVDDVSLRKILGGSGIDFDALRDPWGDAYQAKFSIERQNDVIEINSAGANKTFGDKDDFTALQLKFNYFTPTGLKINKAISDYVGKTGKFVRDMETLRAVLAEKDIDLDELKDRWGEAYRVEFGISGRNYTTVLRSSGTDKKFTDDYYDDFVIWTNQNDYFAEIDGKIDAILSKFISEKKTFPRNEAEFKQVLRDGGIDFDALRDGWDRPFYLQYETKAQFADKIVIENTAKQGEQSKETISITPVTQQLGVFDIRSLGENGVKNELYNDDIYVSTFAGIISEQTKDDAKPKVVVPKAAFANGKSAIYGVVQDANKAVVPNASVTITNSETLAAVETKTNADGLFLQTNLPAGKYSVKVIANGFKTSVVNEIKLEAEKIIEIHLTLEVGTVNETVTVVSASSAQVDLSDSKLTTNITSQVIGSLPKGTTFSSLLKTAPNVRAEPLSAGFQIDGASGAENVFVVDGQRSRNGKISVVTKSGSSDANPATSTATSTPRLREYFPETLLWIPELVTGKDGKISIKFRLADNITTWKIYAIASDTQGKIGIAQKEVKAFQPFFVDLDPPRILTEGDEIYLPTQVRNYTEIKQKVNVEMAPGDWFSFLSAGTQQIEVQPNAAGNAIFGFKAIAAIEGGKQRVTAITATDSDAVEKPVTVRPNGQEIVRTESKLFQKSGTFEINFPANALPKTPKAELKIYPNLMAHVTESVEGLLERPYGCGEQTVSSTYPNLMILKFKSEPTAVADGLKSAKSALEQKAQKYLQKGYERLLGYQMTDGGFSYWGGKDSSDLALTAYALRFLTDAQGFIEVDPKVVENAREFLVKQQRADGSFTKKYSWETAEDTRRTKLLTSYVARTLAMIKAQGGNSAIPENLEAVLQKSLAYLKTRNAEIDEPYALALFGLAAFDAGNVETARETAQRLEKMALSEGDKVYWNLETNTPFYGWGTAGRIETTALVLQLLVKLNNEQRTTNNELISKATMFLLKNKDRYGVWHSTQTTINVLDAFLASLTAGKDQTIAVSMNGEKLKDFAISAEQIEPVVLDLTGKLLSANHLEVTSSDNSAVISQLVETHYIDWKDAEISNRNVNDSRAVRLDYKCDKLAAKIMETINCSVAAERVGFKGYGMLLAEIGIPPGADVSRESLEKALAADWSLSRYDVLPDRIVVYLWSKAGGSKFNFSFKLRYAVNAQTPASILYDYYNEEAKATVAPLKFEMKK